MVKNYYLLLKGASDDLSLDNVKVNDTVNTTPISNGLKYTFSVPTTVTQADVTITANQYAKLVNVAGNALSIPYINVCGQILHIHCLLKKKQL